MMDKYLDQIFSSYAWSDADAKERSSWSCSESEQPIDDNSSPTYMTNSNQSLDGLVAQDASSINIHDFESDAQIGGKNFNTKASNENLVLQYDVANVGFRNCEPSVFQRFNSDYECPSTIPQVWPIQSFKDVSSSLSPGTEQHNFGMTDEYGDNGIYAMASNPTSLPALATTEQGEPDLGNYSLLSFASAPQMTMAMPTVQSLPQTTSTAPSSEYAIGTAKPRTRARRGQATDPHSIAERLRREKIADRMKNLQELVPNSNKTDKASMLDEIIEYVKSLQLQVKALSTSTQGTAEAVSPLITESQQAKGANGSFLSPSIGQVADISFNDVDLVQIVRLMETDMNKAMQHLQTKLGLCLMPIALAEAVAAEMESLSSPPPASPGSGDRKKTNYNDVGDVQNNSSSSSSSNTNSSSSSSSNTNSSLPDHQVKQEVTNNYFAAT